MHTHWPVLPTMLYDGQPNAGPWRNEQDRKKIKWNYFRVFNDLARLVCFISQMHSPFAGLPGDLSGSNQKIFAHFLRNWNETKPKGSFRSHSNSSCGPTKCLHISRIDAGACTPPPSPNHEKWNPITKMQMNAVNYHLHPKSVRPTIVAHSTISDATHLNGISRFTRSTHLLLHSAYARNRHKANRTLFAICRSYELWKIIFCPSIWWQCRNSQQCDCPSLQPLFWPCLNYHFRRIGSVLCHWKIA